MPHVASPLCSASALHIQEMVDYAHTTESLHLKRERKRNWVHRILVGGWSDEYPPFPVTRDHACCQSVFESVEAAEAVELDGALLHGNREHGDLPSHRPSGGHLAVIPSNQAIRKARKYITSERASEQSMSARMQVSQKRRLVFATRYV